MAASKPTHALPQRCPASVGLAQARPNNCVTRECSNIVEHCGGEPERADTACLLAN